TGLLGALPYRGLGRHEVLELLNRHFGLGRQVSHLVGGRRGRRRDLFKRRHEQDRQPDLERAAENSHGTAELRELMNARSTAEEPQRLSEPDGGDISRADRYAG